MAEKITISACLIVRNEEKNLPGCLDTLRSVADEIIVVDTGSSDNTERAARRRGARVYTVPWEEDFSRARNEALERARGDWILVLDADERLAWRGYDAFRAPMLGEKRWGYLLTLCNLYEDRTSEVLLLRLFRNHPRIRFSGVIHERVEPSLFQMAGDFSHAVGRHPARILHTGYLPAAREEKGKDERDLRLLRKQIALDPADPFYHYKFAVHPHVRANGRAAGEAALDAAWRLLEEQDPEGTVFSFTPEVAALKLLQALAEREPTSIRSIAARAARLVHSSPNLEYALGLAALTSGALEQAEKHLETALSYTGTVLPYAPFDGVVGFLSLSALSEVFFLKGDRVKSRQLFAEAAASSDQEWSHAFFGRPEVLIRRGDPGRALLLLSAAARKAPEDPYPWSRGGELLVELGLQGKAAEWFEKARARETAGLGSAQPSGS